MIDEIVKYFQARYKQLYIIYVFLINVINELRLLRRNGGKMKKRKFLAIMLSCVMILCGILSNSFEASAASKMFITPEEARMMATIHVESIIRLDKETSDGWRLGIILDAPHEMYDLSGNISAYYMQIHDENNVGLGYVVVGAEDLYAPIIEYSTDGMFYPAVVMEKYNSQKIIYLGGFDYFIEVSEGYINVSDFGTEKEVIADISEKNVYENEDYSDEWRGWFEIFEKNSGNSTPPSSGSVYITNTDDYESGYDSKTSSNVWNYNITYKTTGDFSGYINHCAPTAATNLMLYWYNRSSSAYSSLRKNGDSSWNDTFTEYYSLMGTTSTGTPNANLQSAYNTYLTNAGFSPTVSYHSSASWSNMKGEIDAGFPFHMVVQGHYLYGDHSVVGLGYVQYKYGLLSYSRYIRVADGWTSSAGRFIHTTVGNSAVRMVKVHPN
jgi:hypothetical protein